MILFKVGTTRWHANPVVDVTYRVADFDMHHARAIGALRGFGDPMNIRAPGVAEN
jgi:hypothetical protein